MESSKKIVLVSLIVAALSAAVVGPAAAAEPSAPEAPALACAGGTCRLVGDAAGPLGLLQLGANLALAQVPFETTADGSAQAALDVKKDLTLALPIGELTLTNARLQAEIGADGTIARLNGSADMPFPTFGLLDDARVVTPARASVGLDLGKNLPDIGVALQPDRPYLFFNADSFLSVAGRTPGSSEEFSLAFTPGQRLALVVDTVDPVAYLDGQVTLSLTDQVELLGGLLEGTPVGPYVPNTLPLRERTQFGLSGKFSKDVDESRLTLKGGYLLDAGFLPAQLGLDARLVNVLGQLTLSRDGILVDGVLQSAIEPDTVFDGSVQVVTFIAFDELAERSYAGIDAGVKVPAARLGVGGGARAGAGEYELNGRLTTPFRGPELAGKVSGEMPDVAAAVGSAGRTVSAAAGEFAGSVGATAGQASQSVGSAVGKAVAFVGPVVSQASDAVSGYARLGMAMAGNALSAGRAKLSVEPAAGL